MENQRDRDTEKRFLDTRGISGKPAAVFFNFLEHGVNYLYLTLPNGRWVTFGQRLTWSKRSKSSALGMLISLASIQSHTTVKIVWSYSNKSLLRIFIIKDDYIKQLVNVPLSLIVRKFCTKNVFRTQVYKRWLTFTILFKSNTFPVLPEHRLSSRSFWWSTTIVYTNIKLLKLTCYKVMVFAERKL